MKRLVAAFAVVLPLSAAAEVKTLPPDEQAALAEGAGAGMAQPAELNGYPGPKHVLELADALGLAPDQRRAAEALFHKMRAEARSKGGEVLEREAALDRLYAERRAEPAAVEALVREIAALRGELRLAHLRTHFEMADLLTPEQRSAYMRLRGHAHPKGGHKH